MASASNVQKIFTLPGEKKDLKVGGRYPLPAMYCGISVIKIGQYHRLRCQPQGAKGAAGYGGRM